MSPEPRSRTLEELNDAITAAERRLNLALTIGEVGVWDYDIQNDVLKWDSRMHLLFGTNPSTFGCRYSSFEDAIVPDDVVPVKKVVMDAIVSGNPFHATFTAKNGRKIRGRAQVYYDKDGKPQRLIGVNVEDFNQSRCLPNCPYAAKATMEHCPQAELTTRNTELSSLCHEPTASPIP
jgi:PAS domain-containing protein